MSNIKRRGMIHKVEIGYLGEYRPFDIFFLEFAEIYCINIDILIHYNNIHH